MKFKSQDKTVKLIFQPKTIKNISAGLSCTVTVSLCVKIGGVSTGSLRKSNANRNENCGTPDYYLFRNNNVSVFSKLIWLANVN